MQRLRILRGEKNLIQNITWWNRIFIRLVSLRYQLCSFSRTINADDLMLSCVTIINEQFFTRFSSHIKSTKRSYFSQHIDGGPLFRSSYYSPQIFNLGKFAAVQIVCDVDCFYESMWIHLHKCRLLVERVQACHFWERFPLSWINFVSHINCIFQPLRFQGN